jgi:hypothetical protein
LASNKLHTSSYRGAKTFSGFLTNLTTRTLPWFQFNNIHPINFETRKILSLVECIDTLAIIQFMSNRKYFWKNCFRSAKHCQDPFLHLIPSQLQHHGISFAGLSHAFYRSRLDDAWSHLLMVQDDSQELRKSFLLTLLSNAELVGEK